jgi:predicted metalloprotease
VAADPSLLEERLNDFVVCLMHIWYGPVVDAGYWLPRSGVMVYTAEIQTPCGLKGDLANAFYCNANQQIYYGIDRFTLLPDLVGERLMAEITIAHEFSHAIQYRTQILASRAAKKKEVETEEEAAEYDRRLEMQADCWAGMSFNALRASINLTARDEANLEETRRLIGRADVYPLSTHGTGANRATWLTRGLNAVTVSACNAWTADPSEVA